MLWVYCALRVFVVGGPLCERVLCSLCLRLQLRARTKSLFSMMKKLLRLGDMAKGGRRPEEIFDLLGLRAVVQPRTDLPPDEVRMRVVQEPSVNIRWHCTPRGSQLRMRLLGHLPA